VRNVFQDGLSLNFFHVSSIALFFRRPILVFCTLSWREAMDSLKGKSPIWGRSNVNGSLNDVKKILPIPISWRTSFLLYWWIESLLSYTKTSNSWSKTNNSCSFDYIGNASSMFSSFATLKLVVATYVPS
jgi:hypothetical protein